MALTAREYREKMNNIRVAFRDARRFFTRENFPELEQREYEYMREGLPIWRELMAHFVNARQSGQSYARAVAHYEAFKVVYGITDDFPVASGRVDPAQR